MDCAVESSSIYNSFLDIDFCGCMYLVLYGWCIKLEGVFSETFFMNRGKGESNFSDFLRLFVVVGS